MQILKDIISSDTSTDDVVGTAVIQELSAFGERHKKAASFDDERLERYIDRKFESQQIEEVNFINLDALPPAVRQFIELQNRVAGRDVGRDGLDYFHPDSQDASLGPETLVQYLRRQTRERWFRWFLAQILKYTRRYEDTYKMLRNAKEATKQSWLQIALRDKSLRKSSTGILMQLKRNKKEHFLRPEEKENLEETLISNQHSQERLKQEKEDLKEYEELVLKPAEEKLNNTVPTEEELENIQKNLTRTMPGRPWRIFLTLMEAMKNQFNSFPRASMDRKNTSSPPKPEPEEQPEYNEAQKYAEQDELDNDEPEEMGDAPPDEPELDDREMLDADNDDDVRPDPE